MKRGYVPVWAAALVTLLLGTLLVALWFTHHQSNYPSFIAAIAPVAWAWWSAIQGVRQRRNAGA